MAIKKVFTDESLGTFVSKIKSYTDSAASNIQTQLDGKLSTSAVSVTQKLTSGTEIGSVTVGSETTKLYAPTSSASDGQLRQYYTVENEEEEYPVIYSYTTEIGTSGHKSTYGAVDDSFLYKPSTSTLKFGDFAFDGYNYTLTNCSNPDNNIYLGDDMIEINGLAIDLFGNVGVHAKGRVNLFSDKDGSSYIELRSEEEDNKYVDIGSSKVTMHGKDSIGFYTGDNDSAYIEMYGADSENNSSSHIDISAERTTFEGSTIAFNSLQIGTYADDVGSIDFMFNGGDAGIFMSYDQDGSPYVDIYGDKVTINGNPIGGSEVSGKRQVTFDELKEFLQSAPIGQQVQVICRLAENNDETFIEHDATFTELGACLVLNEQRVLSASNMTTYNEDEYPRIVMNEYRININASVSDDYIKLTRSYIPFNGETYESEVIIEETVGDGSFEFYILSRGLASGATLTETEKEAIVNDLLARLPVYNGEVL